MSRESKTGFLCYIILLFFLIPAHRCPPVVQASVRLCPEHPGDLPDPRQPPKDKPGGSNEILLCIVLHTQVNTDTGKRIQLNIDTGTIETW